MLVYHITNFANLQAIQNHGLRSSMPTAYEHVGSGIYIFFDKQRADDITEYLGAADYEPPDRKTIYDGLILVITVEVDENELLMDEDALIVYDEHDVERLRLIMPQEAFEEYQIYLKHNGKEKSLSSPASYGFGGDALPIDDPKIGLFKTRLIDKFKIRPSNHFRTNWGHYSVLTARCTTEVLDPVNIEIMYDSELYDLEELGQIKISLEMDLEME